MSLATTTIAAGSLGEQVRNDIQQRNEWVKIINETKSFFSKNPQYNIVELYIKQNIDLGSVNYNNEKVDLKFHPEVRLNNDKANAITEVLSNIRKGLAATGRQEQWGIDLSLIDFDSLYPINKKNPLSFIYVFEFELLNERGKVISSTNFVPLVLDYPNIRNQYNTKRDGFTLGTMGSLGGRDNEFVGAKGLSLVTMIEIVTNISKGTERSPSFTVKASEITDGLSIRLKNISVYQEFYYSNSQGRYESHYKRIQRGANLIPVHNEE
jgi:hypothetical protein